MQQEHLSARHEHNPIRKTKNAETNCRKNYGQADCFNVAVIVVAAAAVAVVVEVVEVVVVTVILIIVTMKKTTTTRRL